MILGITGKIASGKSEVLKILKKQGFYCIDADKIVHYLYKSGGVCANKIATYFGEKFLNNDEVFQNDDERKYLENLIHPEVFSGINDLIGRHKGKDIVIEAVYFDTDFLDDFVDKLIWVDRSEDKIMQILLEDRGFDEILAKKLGNLIEKPNKIDFIFENDGSLQDLEKLVLNSLNL